MSRTRGLTLGNLRCCTVDVIGIGLYYAKAVKFVALLYVILLFLAVKGFLSWLKIRNQDQPVFMVSRPQPD